MVSHLESHYRDLLSPVNWRIPPCRCHTCHPQHCLCIGTQRFPETQCTAWLYWCHPSLYTLHATQSTQQFGEHFFIKLSGYLGLDSHYIVSIKSQLAHYPNIRIKSLSNIICIRICAISPVGIYSDIRLKIFGRLNILAYLFLKSVKSEYVRKFAPNLVLVFACLCLMNNVYLDLVWASNKYPG